MAHLRCSYCSETKELKENLPETLSGRISILRAIGWDLWYNWIEKRARYFCSEKCKAQYQFKGRMTFTDLLLKTKRTE